MNREQKFTVVVSFIFTVLLIGWGAIFFTMGFEKASLILGFAGVAASAVGMQHWVPALMGVRRH